MSMANTRHRFVLRALFLVAAVMLSACLLPGRAHAGASADAASIRTVAQVQTDGALHVVEQRTFVFEGERSGLFWPVTSLEEDSVLEVSSVRFAPCTLQGGIAGEWTALPRASISSELEAAIQATSGRTGSLDAQAAALRTVVDPGFHADVAERGIYLLFPPTEGRVVFECDLAVTNAVRAFDDTAELYWDYVPADADASAASVNVSVQLPMPEGMEAVVGQNVFAWGHGAAGTVNVKEDGTVAFHVPELLRGQYAQAHVLFPQQWLTNLSFKAQHAHSGTRLDEAKSEEETWTDTWSAWLANSYTLDLAFVLVALAALGAAFGLFFAFGREPKPVGPASREDARALLRGYEAPLVGRLVRWGHAGPADLVALLMQLAVRGAVKVEALADAGPLGRGFNDLRIRTGTRAKDVARTPLDQELMRLLFDVWGEGYASVTLSDIKRHATADRMRFRSELAAFAKVLSGAVQEAAFFDARSARVQRIVMVAGCALLAAALLFGVAGGSFVRAAALFIAGGGCIVLGNYTARLTPKGAEVQAAAAMLQRALMDVPPEDVPEEDAPYAFACGCAPDAAVPRLSTENATETDVPFARFWLAPRKGRGGKPMPSFARHLADELEAWG